MTVIENPIINSPFAEPAQHHELDPRGNPTGAITPQRRKSTYLTPIPQPRKQAGMQPPLFEAAAEKEEENYAINQIRRHVETWRQRDYPHVTSVTRKLLRYWTDEKREKRLFFCQIEAIETAIYIAEAARRDKQDWIESDLRSASAEANPGLYRIAFKMATGSGKTVVMAMLIAWQTLNKLTNPSDGRFTDAFLIVTPGVTIRDRLRVLLPGDPGNYYHQRDLVPSDMFDQLHRAKIVITNYHGFLPREIVEASTLTKKLLKSQGANPFTETPGQMVRRVCRGLGEARNIIVINDEAHHCYDRKLDASDKAPKGDVAKEVEERRVWVNGIRAVQDKIGVRVVYDLSATPFFLAGSGYQEGKLFPWVVSDFALIDAIESGIVKIPRLPVADDAMQGDLPVNRNLWTFIRDSLPRRKNNEDVERSELPKELEGALYSLYGSYEKYHNLWQEQQHKLTNGDTANAALPPPVMIVVCNNTLVSKMVYDWISGYEKSYADGTVLVPGNLELFRNENGERWLPRPTTILIDSQQLESGDAMSDDFKKVAAREIETFKKEYRQRYPDRDPEDLADHDLLREVLNSVGKSGRLGENIKCVVSVSMLTEGWDCLDSSTEILTPSGWVGRGRICPDDFIYSLNRMTGKLEVVPVLEYGERPVREGERMIRIKSQHLDIRVTEGHEFHVKYRDPRKGGALSKQFITKTGAELLDRRSSYALPLAAETAEGFPGVPLTDDELRLIAWFMTDGGFSGRAFAITQSKSYVSEIRQLLERLDLDYVERVVQPHPVHSYQNTKPHHVFRIPKGTHSGTLTRNGWFKYADYLKKSVSVLLHQMDRRQFLVFWEELLKGDGEKQENRSGWLWCCEKAQADAYTHMAVVRGLAASCHEEVTAAGKIVYRVSVRDAQWITSDPGDERSSKITAETPQPGEIVWCIRNQNSTLVTRRNGKIAIIGNCNSVTHILGVRAFSTQLICEQVIGRALRRMSYVSNEENRFDAEYAEVYGVPFSFLPAAGTTKSHRLPRVPTRIQALAERANAEFRFPNVIGYRYELKDESLQANFSDDSYIVLSSAQVPTFTQVEPLIGESSVHNLDELYERREKEVVFLLAKHMLEGEFRDDSGEPKVWYFPQLLTIVQQWIEGGYVEMKDNCRLQLLLLTEHAYTAAEKIYRAIVAGTGASEQLKLIFNPAAPVGSSAKIDFETTRNVYRTDPRKCQVNYVAIDSGWEGKMVQSLEMMPEVLAYVKNDGMNLQIPYTLEGHEHTYIPDFIVRIDMGREAEPLNLIVEVTGVHDAGKEAKADTMRSLWIPGVNALDTFGRWQYIEILDPWDAQNSIRRQVKQIQMTEG